MSTSEPENKMERTILIDIASDITYPINLGKQWFISTPSPEKKFGGLILPQVHKKVYLRIGTKKDEKTNSKNKEALIVDNNLKVDKDKLFSIIFNGQEECLTESSKIEIELENSKTYFQLFLNPAAIQDCKEPQSSMSKTYKITLPLVLTNEKEEEIVRKTEVINIKFAEIHTEPKVEIILDKRFKSIEYSSDLTIQKIGSLHIANPVTKLYYPNLNGKVHFHAENNNGDSIPIYLDLRAILTGSNDVKTSIYDTGFFFKNLFMGQTIEVPIYANFGQIGNPYEFPGGLECRLTAEVEYCENEKKSLKRQLVSEATMTITPNQQIIQLGVYVQDWNTKELKKIENGNRTEIQTAGNFVPGNGYSLFNNIVLRNEANEGPHDGAGINIKEIKRKIEFFPKTEPTLASPISYSQSKLSDEIVFGVESWKAPWFLPCVPTSDKQKCYKYGFSDNNIKAINSLREGEQRYELMVRLKLDISYEIVENVGRNESHGFSCNIDWKIFQKPNPAWMGVDFGTSAIVGVFGRSNANVLNLHDRKKALFPNEEDVYEEGTPFLSSNVVFNYGAFATQGNNNNPISQLLRDGFEERPPYKKLAICLSPTSSYEDSNSRYILPCLKLLVGYEMIPNIEKYKEFKYYWKNEEGAVAPTTLSYHDDNTDTDEFTNLAKVDCVFEEVYSELFHYFVQGSLDQTMLKKLNNIILTYPNTYTTSHLDKMEKIVRSGLKNLNLRNVKFVSESDAVACYYQSHKEVLNPNAPRDKETVLVYDMGAGTLDVTLFDVVKEGDNTSIDIKGKIGIAKAGNYIDSVIAHVLSKTFKSLEKYVFQDNINDTSRLSTARLLKQYIKTVIKPKLSEDDKKIELTLNDAQRLGISKQDFNNHAPQNNTISLDVESLIQADEEYKDLISDCTTRFFDNFFKFLGYDEKDEKNRPCVDTIILSGRSAKLKDVQMGVAKAICSWNKAGMDYMVVDLSEQNGADLSKTAVVEGALDFAYLQTGEMVHTKINSPNVMAKFGVKYVNLEGQICYKELLDPFKQVPQNKDKPIRKNGMTVYTYETQPELLTLSDFHREITLIQTYSGNTEEDLKNNNTEYITEIAEYEGASVVSLSIVVNEGNKLILKVNGGESDGVTPSRIDINVPANKMSLWPMLNN